ncbi:MAG: DUF1682 domain-containing protein [Flavobacteriales bacterium]|nr:DUF1682 domain-containing protein [Flavobacteriales bacterium]
MKLHTILITAAMLTASTASIAQKDFSDLSSRQRIQVAEQEQLEAAVDTDFQNLMERGHSLFQEKHYLKAVRVYEEARDKRPYNVYPKVKIADIELSMKDTLDLLKAEEKKELAAERKRPQQKIEQEKDERNDESPEERMKKIDNWEENERKRMERERQKKTDQPTPPGGGSEGDVKRVSLEEYQKELAEKYPSGITEETLIEGNKTIVKRIVVREGEGNEYKRVEHNWGGVFYFKNGDAVTERVWKSETE